MHAVAVPDGVFGMDFLIDNPGTRIVGVECRNNCSLGASDQRRIARQDGPVVRYIGFGNRLQPLASFFVRQFSNSHIGISISIR